MFAAYREGAFNGAAAVGQGMLETSAAAALKARGVNVIGSSVNVREHR